jgi:hypothetical protein
VPVGPGYLAEDGGSVADPAGVVHNYPERG